jgi:transcriptional antiterminator RfaH
MADIQETGKRWYLVYTKARQENIALANLERQGYEVYLPLVRQVRRRLGRRVSAIGAMFPRYLFVRLDSNTDNWAPIRSTLGVVSIVRFGQAPARVPDRFVDYLRNREDGQGIQTIAVEALRPGMRVRVTEGSLMGFEGIYQARTGHDRVVVLLEIMGKIARTAIDRDSLEAAGRS